jgi:hypothetical protein
MPSRVRKRAARPSGRRTANLRIATPRQGPVLAKSEPDRLGFSDLPPELRNYIYELALASSSGGPIPLTNHSGIERDCALNLLATCKAIAREASSVLNNVVGFLIDTWHACSAAFGVTRNEIPCQPHLTIDWEQEEKAQEAIHRLSMPGLAHKC